MVHSQDLLPTYLPKKTPRMVLMGTMVAICARTIDGQSPSSPVFYYHNRRNHFWKVLQHLLEPTKPAVHLSVPEKKQLLEDHRVAITNIVQSVEVFKKDQLDPSDTILFAAQKKGRIQYKKASSRLKTALTKTPVFFTCREKKGIRDLLAGYQIENNLDDDFLRRIWFLATPTRCNPRARSEMWRNEMNRFIRNTDHS